MPQDNLPEQESRITNQGLREETTEENAPTSPEQNQQTGEVKRPEIPDTTKPEMPKEESIPKGGPGDQQTQTQAQAQKQAQTPAQKRKACIGKVKGQLNIKIPAGTPAERKVSGQIEDGHNKIVLEQS